MLLKLSNDFIAAIKINDTDIINRSLQAYKDISELQILNELTTDKQKIVFWSNVYNGWFQYCAQKVNPSDEKGFTKLFFTTKSIFFKDLEMSFDDVEHTILRQNRWKYGLGFIKNFNGRNPFSSLMLEKVDYRVHFILNCGAKSCPLIVSLDIETAEIKLEESMLIYMANEVLTNRDEQLIYINKLFLFYLGDFGGKRGLKRLLFDKGIIKEDALNYKWKYVAFDKSIKLLNFRNN